jgi:hypothetical protein
MLLIVDDELSSTAGLKEMSELIHDRFIVIPSKLLPSTAALSVLRRDLALVGA